MASSPQKNLQFISPPKEAGDFLQNQVKTAGRDDSHSDGEHHPYEPTDYGVLERLANSGYIGKKDTLVDYGSGKGRVSFFLAYQTRYQAIGVEYDRRLWEKALANGQTAASRRRVTFVLADAVEYEIPPLFAGDDDREKILVLRLRD